MRKARVVDIAGFDVSPDHWIGGEREASPDTFETRSPNDWDLALADVARGDASTASAAVSSAEEAAPGWAALSPAERATYLHRLADVIDAKLERVAVVETMDMAMLLGSMQARLVHRGAENFRNYADLAADHVERRWQSKGTTNSVIRMPAGPASSSPPGTLPGCWPPGKWLPPWRPETR